MIQRCTISIFYVVNIKADIFLLLLGIRYFDKGGTAAKLAWPRLNDYFTQFWLCSRRHFELDVFAPTLSKLPTLIRTSIPDKQQSKTVLMVNGGRNRLRSECDHLSDEWKNPLDDYEKENDYHAEEKSNEDLNGNSIFERDPNRCEFVSDVQSFWPNRYTIYDNVAWSVRNVTRNYTNKAESSVKEIKDNMKIQLGVKIAVCPDTDQNKTGIALSNYPLNNSNETLSKDGKAARLELVRIVNGIPIMESTEAQSCGIVHGVANKDLWGSYGLDIDRRTTIAPETSSSTTSFLLRDSNIIAPFIHKNPKHKQLKPNNCEGIRKRNREREKHERDLLPASVRIGLILVVVEIRTVLSSLFLPTLSKVSVGA